MALRTVCPRAPGLPSLPGGDHRARTPALEDRGLGLTADAVPPAAEQHALGRAGAHVGGQGGAQALLAPLAVARVEQAVLGTAGVRASGPPPSTPSLPVHSSGTFA